MKLTAERRNAYIEAGGIYCPFCNSPDIEGEFVEVAAGRATQPLYCLTCQRHWTDHYVLSDVVPTDYAE